MSDFLKISGGASGIDWGTIVDQLIAIESRPATLMTRQKQKLSWEKDMWGEINTKLLSVKTALGSLLDRTKLLGKDAVSSNEGILTADATSSAASATYKITVLRLADATSVQSGFGALGFGLGKAITTTQAVTSATSGFGTMVTAGTFTIQGVSITLDDDDYLGDGTGADGNDLIKKINDALTAAGKNTVSVSYDAMADKLTVVDTSGAAIALGSAGDTSNFLSAAGLLAAPQAGTSKTSTFHLGHVNPNQLVKDANFATTITDSTGGTTGTGSFKINGVEITYDLSNDSLNTLITRINNSTAGVTASFDTTTDRIILQNKATGSTNITLEDVGGNFLAATDLQGGVAGATVTLGDNAEFIVDGMNGGNPLYSTTNDVSDVLSGVTLHLIKEDPANPVTVTINQDTASVKDKIKAWVNAYNDAINLINTRLQEKTVTDKKWENMTDYERKQGLMRGDWTLIQLRNNLVQQVTDKVDGLPSGFNQLAMIGIKLTNDTSGSTAGNLVIDDTVLDKALKDNPQQVADLFFQDADYDNKVDTSELGVAVRLDSLLESLTDASSDLVGGISVKIGLVPRQQQSLDGQMKEIQDRVDDLQRLLDLRRQTLTNQFVAMESALTQLQSQSSWLSAQISKM